MAITGIDHVQVAAPRGCEAEARAFYGALLGFEELPKPEPLAARGGCWFRAGGQELHVGVEDPFVPDTLPHVRRFYAADPFGNRLEFRQA